jgi:hypothetical protein
MEEKYIFYDVDGKQFKILESRSSEFEKDAPNAKINYSVNGKNFSIGLDEKEEFLNDVGDLDWSYTNFEEERPSVFETVGKAGAAAGVTLGKQAVDLTNVAAKQGARIPMANSPLTGLAATIESLTGKSVLAEDSPLNNASVKMGETAERLSKEADPTGGEKDFIDLVKDGNIGLAIQKGIGTSVESLPIMLATKNPYTAGLWVLGSAASGFEDERRNNPDIPAWKAGVNSLLSSTLELAIEKIADPLEDLFKAGKGELTEEVAKGILDKVTKEGSENIAKRIFNYLKGAGKKIGKNALGEGFEEGATSLGNDAIGSALDAIDGNKDYGFSAQWEQYKEENPDADLWDFSKAKARQYLNDAIGGAFAGANTSAVASTLNDGVNLAIKKSDITAGYERGFASTVRDIYDIDGTVKEAEDNLVNEFVDENGDATISREFFNTLSAEQAYDLAQKTDIPSNQRTALRNYAVAKAQQEGINAKLDGELADNIKKQNEYIDSAKEDGFIVTGFYNNQPVYIKGGVFNNGAITLPNGEAGPVIVVNTLTGEKSTVLSNEIQNPSSLDVDTYRENIETQLRENDAHNRDVWRNTKSESAKQKEFEQYVGSKILINTGEGLAEVEVKKLLPNGLVLIKGKKGDLGGHSEVVIPVAQFYDSIYRNDDGTPASVEPIKDGEQPEGIQPTQTSANETPDYRGENVTIIIDGTPVEVEVTGQDNVSDTITYEYTDVNGNRRSGSSTIGAFTSAVKQDIEPSPEEVQPEIPSDIPEVEDVTPEPVPVEETPLEPESINWDELFERDKDAYLAELQKQFGDETLDILNEEIDAAQRELDALAKAKTSSQNERLENRKKKANLQNRINALNEMVARITPAPEDVPETPAEPVAEIPEVPEIEAPEVPAAEVPVVEAPETPEEVTPETSVAEKIPVSSEPEPVASQVVPAAPNPVSNPVESAQIEEGKLLTLLKRIDLNRNEKRDWAYKFGKRVADMFDTREEYGSYEEVAEDLGEFLNDFNRGVEESFANRPQTASFSPVNSVPLTTEPTGKQNGENTTGRGIGNNVQGATYEGTESGNQGASKSGVSEGGSQNPQTKVENKYPSRKGNATQELLIETFGLDSVAIPNSRKDTLNTIYDFMMEMAKTLGISPKSIGQGGWLGVKNLRSNSRPNAVHHMEWMWDGHIVEAVMQFKYARLSSVAHEWFHSLDRALGYFETGLYADATSEIEKSKFTGRAEVWDAMNELVNAIKASGHENRIKSHNFGRKHTEYLLRVREMCARAFEQWIEDKFESAGIRLEGYAYNENNPQQPTAEEMEVIAPAFDNLFNVLQEKEGKNPNTSVLFQIGQEVDSKLEEQYAYEGETEVIMDALVSSINGAGIKTSEVTDEQAEQMRDASGANEEFMVASDRPVFVSNAAVAVEAIKQEKATPEQWLKMIEKSGGLKAGEDKWMGLSDWLKESKAKTLTKQEVLNYIKANTIQIEEVKYVAEADDAATIAYGKMQEILQNEFNAYVSEYYEEHDDDEFYGNPAAYYAIEKLRERFGDTKFPNDIEVSNGNEVYFTFYHDDHRDMEKWSKILGVEYEHLIHINSTRLMYTSDGLENKKEIALVVPTIKSWGEWDDIHFGDAGNGRAIAWVRFGDTETIEQTEETKEIAKTLREFTKDAKEKYGEKRNLWPYDVRLAEDALLDQQLSSMRYKKILVIDEIQSKRHQEGREKGYSMTIEEYEKRLNALEQEGGERLERRKNLLKHLSEKYGDDINSYLKLENMAFVPNENVMTPDEVQEWNTTSQDEIDAAIDNLKKEMRIGIPAAPFEKNWPELAMKRMLRYAAENGYDEIAWTKGEQQAKRYALTKYFNGIAREDNPSVDGKRFQLYGGNVETLIVDNDGKVIDSTIEEAKGKSLSEVVGKEVADKMMAIEDGDSLADADIAVGGDGMKGFYDKMLPSFMNKYGKKWGVKVGESELPLVEAGENFTFHSVPVTESMKESVMEGQPMFMKRPNGKVYGWTDGKDFFYTKDGFNPNTFVHEYTHIWAKAMMEKNPTGWNSIKQLLKDTLVWEEVMNDANYSDIHKDEDKVTSEVLSRISGKDNEKKLRKMYRKMVDDAKGTMRKVEARGLIQNIKDALNQFWGWVGKEFFKIEKFNSVDEITDRVLWDLLNKTNLGILEKGAMEMQAKRKKSFGKHNKYKQIDNYTQEFRDDIYFRVLSKHYFEKDSSPYVFMDGYFMQLDVPDTESLRYYRNVEKTDGYGIRFGIFVGDITEEEFEKNIKDYERGFARSQESSGDFLDSRRKDKADRINSDNVTFENGRPSVDNDGLHRQTQRQSADRGTFVGGGNSYIRTSELSSLTSPLSHYVEEYSIDLATVAKETAAKVYDRVVKNDWQEFQRQFQDAYQPVRIAIDAIQNETGNIPIEDYENYLLIQNQSSSRSRVEIDKFARRYYTPIINQVNAIIDEIMEMRGLNKNDRNARSEVYKEVRRYLIAKHGLERNKYYQEHKTRPLTAREQKPLLEQASEDYNEKINQINSDTSITDAERELQLREALDEYNAKVIEINTREVPDMRDYSGLTSLFSLDAKNFEEAEKRAQDMVGLFESSVNTDELWKKINAATDKTLRHSYESGLLSRQQYNDIKSMFKFYIPLRGFDETTAEDVYSYARFEGNRFNPAVKTAEGRTSIADDPIAIIMNMAESEIAQGNKNRAKQALYNYLLNRASADNQQNSLMQVEDVWYVVSKDEFGNEVHQIAAPDHESGETYEQFESRMRALADEEKAYKSKKGKADVGMRFQKQMNRNAHYVYLKVNGVDKAIFINGDPKAADAINGTYQQKKQYGEEVARTINRLLSSTFTNYSLEFTARNYFRDMIYSHINIGVRESDPAYRKKFRQNWRHNNLGTIIKMLNAYRAGEYEGRPLNEDEAAFVEFMENGGQTGYTVINSVETHKKDLEKAIERMQTGIEKGGVKDSTAFRFTLGAIELLNESSELVTRFAAYKTSRDLGRGIVKSISDAKEVTVNFNTKGAQDGTGWMGAVARYFGWSKFFFNASVQGVQNIAAMAKANTLKFGSVVGGVVAAGFLTPIITAAMSELFGGDEDEYWNIPEYDRQNNFCISIGGGKYMKIPLPIGFREVYAIGDMVAAMVADKKFKRDFIQIGTDMANKISSIVLPINPLESSVNGLSIWHTLANTALPSSMQFITQNLSNVDWKGAPLQKEYTYNANDPQWMKAFAGNPDWMKGLSKWCNENISIDGYYKGWDWSPEKLDNTLSNLFGGIYSLVKKTGQSISMIWNEEERNLSNIPLSGVVLGSGIDSDDRFVTDAYFDMKDFYDTNIGYIKRRAEKFGYDLEDVFLKEKGKHHPKMLEIYNNSSFDFMQEWYKGNKDLEKMNDGIKKLKKEIAGKENPSESKLLKLSSKQNEFEAEKRDFVNDMLELD